MKTLFAVAKRMGIKPRVLLDACRARTVDARTATAAELEGIIVELDAESRTQNRTRAFSLEGPIAPRLDGPGVTFRVDDVAPVASQTPSISAADYVQFRLRTTPICMSVSSELLQVDPDLNPLVMAIYTAFAEHRPLVLDPDSVWLTLAQGFATHVQLNADALRPRFIGFKGRREIAVPVTGVDDHVWPPFVEAVTEEMAADLGPGLRNLLLCDFSTTTPAARTASAVVMMAAFKRYYDIVAVAICGLPRVSLLGTPEDWRTIAARAALFSEYGLAHWTERLAPILEGLVRTAEGAPPLDFWQFICKPESAYGAERITGWLADLFPYLREKGGGLATLPNRRLTLPRDAATEVGFTTAEFPRGCTHAPVALQDPEGTSLGNVVLHGGLMGVRVDAQGLAPCPGWAVTEPDARSAAIARLRPHHTPTPQPDRRFWDGVPGGLELPKALVSVCVELGPGVLWSGTPQELFFLPAPVVDDRFAELADGRALYARSLWREQRFIILVGRPTLQPPPIDEILCMPAEFEAGAVRVVSTAPDAFLEALSHTTDHFFFDAPDFESPCPVPDDLQKPSG